MDRQIGTTKGALLIDVDNFHDPVQLRAAYSQFVQHVGKGAICHAHGDLRILQSEALKPVWIDVAAKLVPCLPLRKNTTDVGLAVDALSLHFLFGIRKFGIASGDADFAPLSLQLRELGCEVTCFSRMAIAFEAMTSYYDRVIRFDVAPVASTSPRPPANQPVSQSPAATVPLDTPKSVVFPATVTTQVSQAKPDPSPVKATSDAGKADRESEAAAVKKILEALPKWLPLTVRQLNQLGAPLREKKIKTGTAPLHQLFRKYPSYFTVLPKTGQPRTVRLERTP